MKFTCDKRELSDALTNLQHAVSVKSTLPVLEGILLRADEGRLRLFAYDLEIGMTTEIVAVVAEPGAIVLGAKLFTDLTRKLPGERVELITDEKLLTTIRSGASEFTVVGIAAGDFPELPSVGDGVRCSLPQDVLLGMIRQTLFAVSQDDSKPVYMGAKFEMDEKALRIVAVDGNRLALRTEPIPQTSPMSFIVPGKTLGELMKLLDPNAQEPVGLSVGRRHILFELGGYTILSRLLEGEFLYFRTVLGRAATTTTRVSVRPFLESVARASLLISDRLKSPLKCVFEGDRIKVVCSTSVGKAYDEVPARSEGETVEIGFNNRYLLDALRACECDEVRIELGGPLAPMKIYPPEGEGFLFLVLPVRLKNS